MTDTARALGALLAPLRRRARLSWLLGGLGSLGLGLGLVGWAARLGWIEEPWWVLAVWAAGAMAVAAVVWFGSRRTRRLTAVWLAGILEGKGEVFRRGALGGYLEPAAAGTSSELYRVADARQAAELASRGPVVVQSLRNRFTRAARRGGLMLVLGAGVLLSARPLAGPAARLWHPAAAWEAAVAPLAIAVDAREVDRGATVSVRVDARGRRHAILWTRAPGESWRGRGLALDSAGHAAVAVGPLGSDLFLRATSGGRQSDTLEVHVRLPAFLGSLTVTARYPAYVRLEDEPISTAGDTVFVPAGTRLETRGEATAPLATARWVGPAVEAPLAVTGARFAGSFTPIGQRSYQLQLVASGGRAVGGDTIRVPVVAVPDSAPRVDIPFPGVDTVLPLTLRMPLVVDVQDDHGVGRAVLASRRISRLGLRDSVREETLPLPSPEPNRAVLTYQFDLGSRGLLPGDTVRYRVRVTDNAPTPNVTASKEYLLTLPTLTEIRQADRERAAALGQRLDSITKATRQLERQTEDLARERSRPGSQGGAGEQALSFESAQRAQAVAASQQELMRQAEEAKQELDALRRSAEAAGLDDPALREKLEEIRSELDKALTPELRERLAELQQALQSLDPERTREALEHLAEAQRQLRESLERSRELFRRAATEGQMANLAAEARDLEQAQRLWNQQVQTLDSTAQAREERNLATRADSLGSALSQLGHDMAQEGAQRQQVMNELAGRARQAAPAMRQAARSASRGQRAEARKEGEQALDQLSQMDQTLDQQREQLQQEWRQAVLDALDNSMSETSRLAERQLALSNALDGGESGSAVRSEQAAVQEGVERLLDRMKELSGQNALVSPSSSVALAAARDQMRKALDVLENANPNTREAGRSAGEAVDALNAATHTMLRSRGAVSGSASGSGLAEAIQQMNQLAQQQGQLGQQGAGLLPMAGTGAVQEQIQRLGAAQRALAERLERLQAGGELPGAGEMAEDAKDLARRLEAGRIDRQTVQRQERLFRRMLDAGRTLQGQEEDERKERQSTTARGDSVHLPPPLRSLRQASDSLYRGPSWEALQSLSPEERRTVLEYFRRLAEQPVTR